MEFADADSLRQAIKEEIQTLQQYGTWTVAKIPSVGKAISTRFVFRKKLLDDGTVGRYKARLVARGCMQVEGDYTFSPVVNFSTIRTCLAVAIQRCTELEKGQALRLNRGLYGLRQAAQLWFERWQKVMKEIGVHSLKADTCVFRSVDVWILLYVGDMIMMGKSADSVNVVKTFMSKKLDIKDLVELGTFLGFSFAKDYKGAWLSQKQYTLDILDLFGMADCKTVITPAIKEDLESGQMRK